MKPARIVITGGPYAGKTTVIEALAARGYLTVPEAAIVVIAELNEEHGVDGQKAWRNEHRDEFQRRIIAKQLELEEAAFSQAGPVFLDRGRLDGLAYCRLFGAPVPTELRAACETLPYDRVFLLDTLKNVVVRSDTGRTSDRERSLKIRDAIRAAYLERGLEPVFVPELPVEERVESILGELGLG